jgi:hypothetical protein
VSTQTKQKENKWVLWLLKVRQTLVDAAAMENYLASNPIASVSIGYYETKGKQNEES